MMAAVFMMQPLGQMLAQLVGLAVLSGYNNRYPLTSCASPDDGDCGMHVDSIWRWVTGCGAIPAVVAIYYRFRIKDPGLYDLDVKNEGERAVENTVNLYSAVDIDFDDASVEMEMADGHIPNGYEHDVPPEPPLPRQYSKEDIVQYFWEEGNWRTLAGTSLCWFLLDV
jgi:MFS transporter, PHS family, inorganic phosphate transporter